MASVNKMELEPIAMDCLEVEEDLACASSNPLDAKFDCTIGHIEEIIMDDEFQEMQNTFMEKYWEEFEDSEENKFIYTDIHKEYTNLIEKYLEEQLHMRMPDFSMAEFQKQIISRRNELEGEVFEMLSTFSDFLAFKEMFLDYRAAKEGRTVDFSQEFTITSMSSCGNGVGMSIGGVGVDLQLGPTSNGCNTSSTEEAMVEGNTPRGEENGVREEDDLHL